MFLGASSVVRILGSSGPSNQNFMVQSSCMNQDGVYGSVSGNVAEFDCAALVPPWSGGGASVHPWWENTYISWWGGEVIGETCTIDTAWGQVVVTVTGIAPVTYSVAYGGMWSVGVVPNSAQQLVTTSYPCSQPQWAPPIHYVIPATVITVAAPDIIRHIIVNYT